MKVAIIGTVGVPARYGGFETLAHQLVANLKGRFNFSVYCSSKGTSSKPSEFEGAKLIYLPLKANGIQSIPYDILSILHALLHADVLLVLGVSGCVILPFVRMFSSKQVIVNIDGIEWKRAKWNKYAKWFLRLSERLAVRYAHTVIVDNAKIKRYVTKEYGSDSVLIAYGADHVATASAADVFIPEYKFLSAPYAFSVCRIEPENKVHVILEAFSESAGLPLVFVGNWNNSDYGRDLRARYEKMDNIHLLDPIYDQVRLDALRGNCTLYVHGHSAGGTNPSLVEAMYLGLPIVAFDVAYNRETTGGEALYFVDGQSLMHLIMNLGDVDLPAYACCMRKVAHNQYTWSRIAGMYSSRFGMSTECIPQTADPRAAR